VLISKSGRLGHAAVVPEQILSGSFNIYEGVALLRMRGIDPYYVAAAVNSSVAQAQVRRRFKGVAQPHLHLEDIERIRIPIGSAQLIAEVRKCVLAAVSLVERAEGLSRTSEQQIVGGLGLADWRPPQPLTYTRRASHAMIAGRLDAEYFAPRVRELIRHLSADGLTVKDVAPARHEDFDRTAPGEFSYIEIGDVGADGSVTSTRLARAEAPSRASSHVRTGDILTSTVRPVRRLSAQVSSEQDGFVCSSGFVVLKPTAVSSELLLTYLRLRPICELMDLHTSASMYPAISERDLLAIPFRRVPPAIEKQIVIGVRDARAARRKAGVLLEQAKRAVEIAIEDSEAAALRFLAQPT
jgi:hypothetical protein